jgi:glyoxylase-like metal-dependent hydrolase (beta-lactamase superfamily II)
MKVHGVFPRDISHIFITHSHPDHIGNVNPILRSNPKAKVYIHPLGAINLIDPSIEVAKRKSFIPPAMMARLGEMEPVPQSRIECLKDGDIFDLGDGEELRIIFAPGHQPDGIAIFERKNRGLFISDLVGNYFPDEGSHYPLNPPGSDHQQGIQSLQKLLDLQVSYLFLGHYGISDEPEKVIVQAIKDIQQLLDIGTRSMQQGNPGLIADEMYQMILPELEKLRKTRGEAVFQYAAQEHIPSQAQLFIKYSTEHLGK